MNKLYWIAITAGSVLLTLSQTTASAQSCFTFTDDYGVYLSVSGDGTNIYTSVLVDGQGTMNITGGNGCGSINYGSAQHIPQAVWIRRVPELLCDGAEQSGHGIRPDRQYNVHIHLERFSLLYLRR
jgi:hypothetical protein